MAIRKWKTKTKGWRYAARVHLGGGEYKLLETRSTKAAARKDEADWISNRRRSDRTRAGEFADFYLEGYAEKHKASSLSAARSAIRCWRQEFGNRSLETITETEAEEWARANRWAVPPVVTLMNDAVKKRVLERNPFTGLTRKGPGRRDNEPLTVADVEKLAAVAEHEHGKGLGAFVLFTAYSGMRVGEVFALQWGDIDFKGNRINVRRRLYRGEVDLPKGNKARQIVLLPEARDALLALDRSTEWIFLGKRGGRMSASTLAYYWQKVETGFGKHVEPHELKHFCGHHLYVTLGLPDRVVAVQLGHSDGGKLVRELYGHGDVGALEEIEKATKGGGAKVLPFRKASDG